MGQLDSTCRAPPRQLPLQLLAPLAARPELGFQLHRVAAQVDPFESETFETRKSRDRFKG
jgi:hypothetical protein